jgi:predicted solute-binding protein
MTARLRIAAVSYLNAVPLVWGLKKGPHRDRFDLQFILPSACADALRASRVDAGIIPSIEYQRIDSLKIVPGLCIASSGPVRSVMLIARRPLSEIRSIALDTSSRTSACLLQILLQQHFRIAPRLLPHPPDVAAMLRECEAALLIGDPSLASDFPGLDLYDLADAWKEMTGLPFVFALWAARRELATPELAAALQESAAYAMAHLDEMVREESQRTGLPLALVHAYLTENIDFNLDERNLAGLRLFFSMAHQLGLIAGLKQIDFIAQRQPGAHAAGPLR